MKFNDLFNDSIINSLDLKYYPKILEILSLKLGEIKIKSEEISSKISNIKQTIYNEVIRETYADGKRIYKSAVSSENETEYRLNNNEMFKELKKELDTVANRGHTIRCRYELIRRQSKILQDECLLSGVRTYEEIKSNNRNTPS